MESWIPGLVEHGYTILCILIFVEAIGLPLPAAPALLIVGAAGARGLLSFPLAYALAIAAMLTADVLLFVAGRYTGWWLLSMLCRLSLNPESCVMRSAESFRRRGRALLVIAKFLPGINALSAPMAGSMKMRFARFLRWDFLGAALYTGLYLAIGYIGADVLGAIFQGYHTVGNVVGWLVPVAVAIYLAIKFRMWWMSRGGAPVPYVLPHDAARELAEGAAIIYDVRSHGYYDRHAVRIRGSRRMEPSAIEQLQMEDVAAGQRVYLYCT
jgi:membrane protein DedA with SNARE-associated domain